jgi:hypothetical protein
MSNIGKTIQISTGSIFKIVEESDKDFFKTVVLGKEDSSNRVVIKKSSCIEYGGTDQGIDLECLSNAKLRERRGLPEVEEEDDEMAIEAEKVNARLGGDLKRERKKMNIRTAEKTDTVKKVKAVKEPKVKAVKEPKVKKAAAEGKVTESGEISVHDFIVKNKDYRKLDKKYFIDLDVNDKEKQGLFIKRTDGEKLYWINETTGKYSALKLVKLFDLISKGQAKAYQG